tara:strand:- start:522 stop:878 length:357 start_codon:yes stop_codon:yes gene_type:complete
MKADLERYPERGRPQRVLISPQFEIVCPRPIIEMIQPIVDVYGIAALGFVYSPNNPLKAWSILHEVEILEWARPEWMHSSIEAFKPTLILAAESDDVLNAQASEHELPVLTFREHPFD